MIKKLFKKIKKTICSHDCIYMGSIPIGVTLGWGLLTHKIPPHVLNWLSTYKCKTCGMIKNDTHIYYGGVKTDIMFLKPAHNIYYNKKTNWYHYTDTDRKLPISIK